MVLNVLVKFGALLDQADHDGNTALHLAVLHGSQSATVSQRFFVYC